MFGGRSRRRVADFEMLKGAPPSTERHGNEAEVVQRWQKQSDLTLLRLGSLNRLKKKGLIDIRFGQRGGARDPPYSSRRSGCQRPAARQSAPRLEAREENRLVPSNGGGKYAR